MSRMIRPDWNESKLASILYTDFTDGTQIGASVSPCYLNKISAKMQSSDQSHFLLPD